MPLKNCNEIRDSKTGVLGTKMGGVGSDVGNLALGVNSRSGARPTGRQDLSPDVGASPLALMLRRSVIFISIFGNMWGRLGLRFRT